MLTMRVGDGQWLPPKFLLILWAILYGIFTPDATESVVIESIRWVWLTVTAVGAAVSVVGIFVKAAPGGNQTLAYLLEVGGLSAAIVGPLIYFTTQVTLIVAGDPAALARVPLSVLPLIIASMLVARMLDLREKDQRSTDHVRLEGEL